VLSMHSALVFTEPLFFRLKTIEAMQDPAFHHQSETRLTTILYQKKDQNGVARTRENAVLPKNLRKNPFSGRK
jgi:hypothetical protein